MSGTGLISDIRVLEWGANPALRYAGHLLAGMGAGVERVTVSEAGSDAAAACPDDQESLSRFFAFLDSGKSLSNVPLHDLADRASGADVIIYDRDRDGSAPFARNLPETAVVIAVGAESRASATAIPRQSDMIVQHRGGVAFNRARPVADPLVQPPIAGAPFEMSMAAGVGIASACLAGLLARRKRGGAGPRLDFSLLDYTAYIGIEALAEWEAGARSFERKRTGRTGVEVAGGSIWVLPCADGWIMASPREEHQWQRWLPVIGSPGWSADADLCGDRRKRKINWERIQQLMGEHTAGRTKAELFAAARTARVPCFPVSTIEDLFANEQLAARSFFNRMATKDGPVSVPGVPFRMVTPGGNAPARGVELKPAIAECATAGGENG
ncbi:MAG: CoA transferase [Blastomonas sp.]